MTFVDFREPVSAWTHCAGLLLAGPATVLLWQRSAGDRAKRWSMLVYGLSVAFCYGASTLYHGARLPADWIALFDRLDHIGIFFLIAGSYTPVAWNLMRGRWRWGTLGSVWLLTAVASALLVTRGSFPRVLSTCLYLGMGWGGVVCYSQITKVVSHRACVPLVVGGVAYSVGAVLNLLQWPILWPDVFMAHELFHLFVLGGSIAHYWFILKVVAPFRWEPPERSRNSDRRAAECAAEAGSGCRLARARSEGSNAIWIWACTT